MAKGNAGETAAVLWFNLHGWHMFRHQLPTRTVKKNGVLTIVACGRGGVADYTGYRGDKYQYVACEVKESPGPTMKCSRLSKVQHEKMQSLPIVCRKVGILWSDTGVFEVFPYKETGSYKQGEGVA